MKNFNKDMVVVDERAKLVVVHDRVRDVLDRDVHAFIVVHGRVKVEVLDVNCHEAGFQGGENTVEKEFDSC